jgi:hypothetical protein
MEFLVIKCPKGCPETFWTRNEMLNHHLVRHERPFPLDCYAEILCDLLDAMAEMDMEFPQATPGVHP